MKKTMKILIISLLAVVMVSAFSVAVFAEAGNVAGAIEGTWNAAETQILGTAYFDYRKSGQFEWTAPAILFACLVFTLTAPLYIWQIIGGGAVMGNA